MHLVQKLNFRMSVLLAQCTIAVDASSQEIMARIALISGWAKVKKVSHVHSNGEHGKLLEKCTAPIMRSLLQKSSRLRSFPLQRALCGTCRVTRLPCLRALIRA